MSPLDGVLGYYLICMLAFLPRIAIQTTTISTSTKTYLLVAFGVHGSHPVVLLLVSLLLDHVASSTSSQSVPASWGLVVAPSLVGVVSLPSSWLLVPHSSLLLVIFLLFLVLLLGLLVVPLLV